MIRGSITNTLPPTLWIHSSVVLVPKGKFMLVGPMTYDTQRLGWLWGISHFVQPIIIYIDQKPSKDLSDWPHLCFDSISDARTHLNRDLRAIEMVVNDSNLVCSNCVLYTHNLKRYC